jgi:hypothetical protein
MHSETTSRRRASAPVCRGAIALMLVALSVPVFEPRATSAEPWKPTGELARVEFDKRCALISLPVNVNGEPHQFLLDTGCTRTLIDTKLTKELRPLSTRPFQTEGKAIQVPTYIAPRLTIKDFTCDITHVGSIDMGPFREAEGGEFQGILGMDVLRSTLLHIDFDNGLVIFCDPKSVQQPPGKQTPLRLDDSLIPHILLRPRGMDEAAFAIDTGMDGTGYFSKELMDALRHVGGLAPTGITNQSLLADASVVTETLERCKEVDVAGHLHTDLLFSQGETNKLGFAFLRRHRVTLDFGNGRAFFEPGELYTYRDRHDRDGLVVDWEMVVQHVVPGSVADRAGVQVADRLVKVGATTASLATWPIINRILLTPRSSKLTLIIDRDGRQSAISIPGG